MTVKRKKKMTKYRGSKTHGGGAMKKRRGAGNRGGRGMAGTGKRGDAKKPSIWKNKLYFGKHGFKSRYDAAKSINIMTIDEKLTSWASKGLIEAKQNIYNIDLKKLGYDKLIGSGKTANKLNITVEKATPKAIEVIKKAGGDVKVTEVKKAEKVEKPAKAEKPEAKLEKVEKEKKEK